MALALVVFGAIECPPPQVILDQYLQMRILIIAITNNLIDPLPEKRPRKCPVCSFSLTCLSRSNDFFSATEKKVLQFLSSEIAGYKVEFVSSASPASC